MVQNKKKKRKNWIASSLSFIKKYEVPILIAIGAIGLLSLYFNYQSNKLAKKQFELSKIPTIEIVKLYETDKNIDLIKLEFKSQTPDFVIKGYKLIIPSDFTGDLTLSNTGNTLNGSELNDGIYSTVTKYIDIPKAKEMSYGAIDYSDCYPIGIIFNYIYKGEELELLNTYRIKFTLYDEGKLKIKDVEIIKSYTEGIPKDIQKEIDGINKKECVGYLCKCNDGNNPKLTKEKLLKLYGPIFELIKISKLYQDYQFYFEDAAKKIVDSSKHHVPIIVVDSTQSNKYNRLLFNTIDNLDSLDIDIKPEITEIEKFLLSHPLCYSEDAYCIEKSKWINKETQEEWANIHKKITNKIGDFLISLKSKVSKK